ncbi:MAG: adenine deaminase [Spirochaetaceae bacterium]|nr:MAG: adenine deaminase [Spirochaetaceae bacterium]
MLPGHGEGMYHQTASVFPSERERFRAGRVALGLDPPDRILQGGAYLNVFTRRIERGDIWIAGRLIAKITTEPCRHAAETVDVTGKLLLPGFIEGHIHVESSLCDPVHFAKAALECGVTSVFTDFHEVGAVAGRTGMEAMIAALRRTPVKGFLMTPIELPFLPEVQHTVSRLTPVEAQWLLAGDGTVGLAEVNGRKIVEWLTDGRADNFALIADAVANRRTPEGHLFFTRGDDLDACLAVGVSSDHEPRKPDEVVEKVSKGLFVMLRNGTLAREVETLVGTVVEHQLPSHRIGLVTDDMLVSHMTPDRYMLHKVRTAIDRGVAPIDAICMVTHNLAEHYRVGEIVGALRPGAFADVVILDSLDSLEIQDVYASGSRVTKEFLNREEDPAYEPALLHTVPRAPVCADTLQWLPSHWSDRSEVTLRAVELDEATRFTNLTPVTVPVRDGEVSLDNPSDELLFMLCANRVRDELVGTGFLKGYGITRGAVAVSLAHDHHGVVGIGNPKEALCHAVNRVIELQGGLVLVDEDRVVCEIALPLAGVMAVEPPASLRSRITGFEAELRARGARWREPLFFLFWLGMEVAPFYRISDYGLFDTEAESVVSPFTEDGR